MTQPDPRREVFEARDTNINYDRKDTGEYADVWTESEWQEFSAGWTAALQWAASQQAPGEWNSHYAVHISRIQQPYTLAELREKIDSKEYCAELLLQHAMRLLGASQQAADGWRLVGYTCGDGDCGRIHDEMDEEDGHMQPVYVRTAPSTQGGADEQR